MLSAADAELGALFTNNREAMYMRKMIEEIGHKQDQTTMQTDNSTAEGVTNKNL